MSSDLIISYDGTPNDDDALALGKLLAAAGASPAQATPQCTSFGSLPSGPPPAVGQITVIRPNGTVVTPPPVPGPCSAPGSSPDHPVG